MLLTAPHRIVNASITDYLVPVNADVPALDAVFIDEPDPHVNPLDAKGLAEIALIGIGPAIANAVFNATGKRVRSLPIVPELLLQAARGLADQAAARSRHASPRMTGIRS